jgi:hypothetical protein
MVRRGRRRQSSLRAEFLSSAAQQQDNSSSDGYDVKTIAAATPSNIATPDKLHTLATNTLQYRKHGSKNVIKAWLHWRTAAIDAIRCDVSHRLLEETTTSSQIGSSLSSTTIGNNDNSCTSSFEDLHYKLGIAADTGLNGDGILFNNAIARCGYAVNFLFSRATNLADLLIDSWNSKKKKNTTNCDSSSSSSPSNLIIEMLWNDDDDDDHDELKLLSYTSNDRGSYSVISLGGGPGFDYVGIALASSFVSYYTPALRSNDDDENIQQQQQQQQQQQLTQRRINVTVFDYEVGWQNIVTALSDSTRHILHHSTNHVSCTWGGQCDITKSLYDPINNACQEQLINAKDDSVPTLYICQYCIAENVVSLRTSKYIFFHQLFDTAIVGSMFVLTEVHPRAWPDFYKLINNHCPYMHIGFSKSGRRMILRKMKCSSNIVDIDASLLDEKMQHDDIISERDLELINKFEELDRLHEKNILSGYRRQTKR